MSKKAIDHLSKDKAFKEIIGLTNLPKDNSKESVYESLIKSITSQQLSVKAADTIHGRFLDLFQDRFPDPKRLVKMNIEELRSAGLSQQKAGYVQNVATFFMEEKILNKDWSNISDEEVIRYLTQIKGVGKWTVQMILMFTLKRPDVFPIDDLGIRNAMVKLYGLDDKFSKDRAGQKLLYQHLIEIAEAWSPFRTLACRYLWKWDD